MSVRAVKVEVWGVYFMKREAEYFCWSSFVIASWETHGCPTKEVRVLRR